MQVLLLLLAGTRAQLAPSPPAFPITLATTEEECQAACAANNQCCSVDVNPGHHQMLSCLQCCVMRVRGLDESTCLDSDIFSGRNGSSGCNLVVDDYSYSMCSTCPETEAGCNGPDGSCELGCRLGTPSALQPPPSPPPSVAVPGSVLTPTDTTLTSTLGGVTTRCSLYSDDGICLLPEFLVGDSFYRLYSQSACGGIAPQLWCYVSTQGDSDVVGYHESTVQEVWESDGHALRFTMNYAGCGCLGCDVTLSAGGYTISGYPQDTDNLYFDNIMCDWGSNPPPPPPSSFTITSGWEAWPGMDHQRFNASLGWYGNIESVTFETNGCRSGEQCLKMVETLPLSGTPQVYVAFIDKLVDGDIVTATFWAKGSGTTTKARIWAHFTEDDHTSYDGSASGSLDYVGLEGVWEKAAHTWTVPVGKSGMLIEGRIFAYDDGYGDEPAVWIDDLTVTVTSATAIVATAPAYESDFSPVGEVLGTDTAGDNNLQVEQVNEGCYSYGGCYKAVEDPIEGTPQVWIAAVYNLGPYDHVFGQLWVQGAGSTASAQLWASYFENDDYNSFAGSHMSGGGDYKGMEGEWGVSSFVWPVEHGKTGLLISARVYVDDPTYNSVLIDNLLISTNSTTAYVEMAPVVAPPPPPAPPAFTC